ncbi:MAG: BstYI [Fimbriimonas ginsengisoli]|uniref:BstYI n=1 Tax=Fimbriimonas ginsengisoli TaxID=1005039 RepID=A0A931PSL4_FIMGI|nr:BstYI [Fimbriimonas ginsengisoli]
MKVVYAYSHLGGEEILSIRKPLVLSQIREVIGEVEARRLKISKEKTMPGRPLFSPKDMNRQFRAAFNKRGFNELRDRYTLAIPNWSVRIPGAFKQVDFVKERVLTEVQFGKYAFMFYDVAKFQYFYNEEKADVGVEIVPCHALQKQMSSGVSYGEHLVYDIERLKRHFPAVPIMVILIDADDAA